MAALPGYVANIFITATSSSSFTNLVLVDSGDHQTFQAANTEGKRYWDPTVALTVQTTINGGGAWNTVTSYNVLYCGGRITLPSALTGTPGVRVSGSYLPVSFLGNAKSIELKVQGEIVDITSFQSPPVPWKEKLFTLADVDIALSKWWVDTVFFAYLSQRCVIVAYSNVSPSSLTPNQRYEGFAYLKSEALKFVENNVDTEDLDFTTDGPFSYYQS
jgi:hypothetical protein